MTHPAAATPHSFQYQSIYKGKDSLCCTSGSFCNHQAVHHQMPLQLCWQNLMQILLMRCLDQTVQYGCSIHLNTSLNKLLNYSLAIMICSAKDVKALLLVIFYNHLGNFRTGSCTYDGCKARGRTINKLNTSFLKMVSSAGPVQILPASRSGSSCG